MYNCIDCINISINSAWLAGWPAGWPAGRPSPCVVSFQIFNTTCLTLLVLTLLV